MASGPAPGAIASEVRETLPIHDGFGHDGAGCVAAAQEQNIEMARRHPSFLLSFPAKQFDNNRTIESCQTDCRRIVE